MGLFEEHPGCSWFRVQYLDQWNTDEKNPGLAFVEASDLSHAVSRFENGYPHACPIGPHILSVVSSKAQFLAYHGTKEQEERNKPCYQSATMGASVPESTK